jgi:hypothetical protein
VNSATRTRGRLGAAALAYALVSCGGGDGGGHAFPIPGERGTRVVVEVLNASGRAGLARSGTRVLRRAGIDVVHFGNAPAGTERVRDALGVGTVVEAADPDLLLDVSVLLGADFAPPQDLHP